MISTSLPSVVKNDFRSSSGTPCWPQSHIFFEQPSTATAARLIARCTSSRLGESRVDGTLSCTSTWKNGRCTKRKPLPTREHTRFLIALSELRVQLSSAWYVSLL